MSALPVMPHGHAPHGLDPSTLVQQANHIAEFFQAMPDREEALLGIAQHIRRFWAPSMRQAFAAHLAAAAAPGVGLHPLLAEAVQRHSAEMGL